MKRKLLLEFDYCERNPKIILMGENHLYVEAPKVLLPGVMKMIDNLIVKGGASSIEQAVMRINKVLETL